MLFRSGFVNYVWSTGETTQSITQSPVLPTCYNVTVLDLNGCANADTICVNVVFPSDVGIQSLVTPTDHQCENASTPITVTVKNYGSNTATDIPLRIEITGSITRTFNDTLFGSIPAGGSIPFTIDSTFNSSGGGNFTITAYTIFASDQSSGNDTLISDITINPVPPAPVGGDNSRCGPGPVTLTGTAVDTIYWYDAPVGGNLVAIGTFNIPYLLNTTTYYAQTGFSCPSATRDTVTATIIPLPPVQLGQDTLIQCGDTITLDAGAGYVVYNWSTSATTQTIDVDTLGDYSVTVIDTNGCSNSDTIHVDCYVGITTLSGTSGVNLFPNPSTGIVTVELGNSIHSATLRWIDVQGALVSEDHITGLSGKKYDLSSVKKGIYLLQVISDEGVSVHRVIIQ